MPTLTFPLLIVDIEATCEKDRSQEVQQTIEIGAVVLENPQVIASAFSELIQPTVPMSKFCSDLTGISHGQLAIADDFVPVWYRFREWFRDCCSPADTMASWGRMDFDLLKADCDRTGAWFFFDHHIDLARLARQKLGRSGRTSLMKKFDIHPVGTIHRGLNDAIDIARIVPYLVD